MSVMKRMAAARTFGGGTRRGLFEVEWFFDRQVVIRQTDRATRRVLSRFGAFVRRTPRG